MDFKKLSEKLMNKNNEINFILNDNENIVKIIQAQNQEIETFKNKIQLLEKKLAQTYMASISDEKGMMTVYEPKKLRNNVSSTTKRKYKTYSPVDNSCV